MSPTLSFTLVVATALFSASNVAAGVQTPEGCFSSSTGLTYNSTYTFNSVGYCSGQCLDLGNAVFGLTNSTCYCGNLLPPSSSKTDDSSCMETCPGYNTDTCGGFGLWSVYLTGLTSIAPPNANPAAADQSSSSQSSASAIPSSSGKPPVVTVGQTVVVTSTPTSTSNSTSSTGSSNSSNPSKAGIAAGVVVGLTAIGAIAGGISLLIRNRRRREVEEEYRRNAAVSSFIAGGGKPPGSSGTASLADLRLEPAIMAHRRMSDGSIADDQDYSRRILKVTNA